ncbi:MAG: GDSL-type esterase/lipase family protein [Victivallales bacterium]|jgi:lysophospholipase L1-like esterase
MKIFKTCLALALAAAGAANCLSGELLLKSGDKLAFLGDSITQQGGGSPGGYARLVISGLDANGIKVEPVFAGIGGHKSNDMLARVDKDVLSKKPNVMTLSCGVNDVWHGERGVPLDKYKENITALVDKVQAADVKPVILTSTMIGEDQPNSNNQKLIPYNEFLRTFAKERKLPLADLNSQMQEAVKKAKETNAPKPNRANYLTGDGVHMAPQGDQMMAEGVLRALGLDDAKVAKAKAAWLEIPAAVKLQNSNKMLSIKEYNKLASAAARENLSVAEYIDRETGKVIDSLLAK